jgi:hypothetical protein
MIAFLVGVSNNLSFISETSSNHQTTIPTMSQESSVQGRKKARTGTVGNRATRANSHLPEYFTQPIDYSEMRSHLVCKTDPNAFSHFISIPMKEYRSFLANESLTPAEKEEFEAKNVWALKDMTRDQLWLLCCRSVPGLELCGSMGNRCGFAFDDPSYSHQFLVFLLYRSYGAEQWT